MVRAQLLTNYRGSAGPRIADIQSMTLFGRPDWLENGAFGNNLYDNP